MKGGQRHGNGSGTAGYQEGLAYDLIQILKEKLEKQSYTTEEIKKIIRVYLTTADQKQTIC